MLADTLVQLDISWLNVVVGLVIPLLVALLTKSKASSGLKASLNLLLSAIGGVVMAAVQNDGKFLVSEAAVGILTVWLPSIVSYVGLWKPTKVAPALAAATANVGVGGSLPTEATDATSPKTTGTTVRRRKRPTT